MNYFLFRSTLKSMNFQILKNSNNILLIHIILFTTYTITINNLYHYRNVDLTLH